MGFLALHIGGVPYYYDDGVYYQPMDGGYQEVYPPVGAPIPQPPDSVNGAVAYQFNGIYYEPVFLNGVTQ